jgi:hypothetical protein
VLQTAAANVARFDHSPTTFESLGLEIEEQRTNLLLRSEEFNYATWAKNDLNVTSNTVVAPNGELTGDKLVENTASSFHLCNQAFTVTNATTYTFSVFLKAAERGFAFVGYNTGSLETTFVSVNLSLGTISTAVGTPVASSIQNVGNGWYRVSITLTSTGTNYSQADIRTSVDGVWANRNYTGDGYSGIYVWGAQLEVGAFPTSYIKTEASQVTRSADAASMTGANFSSWYRADEGTLFAQTQRTGTNDTSNEGTGIEITSGEFQKNLLQLMYDSGSFNRPKLRIISNVSADVNGVSGSSPAFVYGEPPAMFAAAYKSGDSGLSKGGSTVTTSTTAFLPPVVSFLSIKTTSNGSQGSDFNGYIRKIAYYPLRLTNAQLQALTS